MEKSIRSDQYANATGIAVEGTDGDLYYVSDNQRVPTKEYYLDVGRGLISGAQTFGSYGERTTSGAETNRII